MSSINKITMDIYNNIHHIFLQVLELITLEREKQIYIRKEKKKGAEYNGKETYTKVFKSCQPNGACCIQT